MTTSATVSGPGYSRWEPSGREILIMGKSKTKSAAWRPRFVCEGKGDVYERAAAD